MNAQRLDRDDIRLAIETAKASYERYRKVAGHYKNSLLTHVVGHAGELASERWFLSMNLSVDPHWRRPDLEALCDLTVASCRIEVKTWSARFWPEFGRSVAVAQLPKLAKKTGVILWATVEGFYPTIETWHGAACVEVAFRGFSTVKDLKTAPIKISKSNACTVRNHQLDEVRGMGPLLDALKGESAVRCSECGTVGCITPAVGAVFK